MLGRPLSSYNINDLPQTIYSHPKPILLRDDTNIISHPKTTIHVCLANDTNL